MTNYDCIKNMNIKELSFFLADFRRLECCCCMFFDGKECTDEFRVNCNVGIAHWLQMWIGENQQIRKIKREYK